MNIERFHNELAMRLGYEGIVNDKRITISVEESDDPIITIKTQGTDDDITFKASECTPEVTLNVPLLLQQEIKDIINAVHQTYIITNNYRF